MNRVIGPVLVVVTVLLAGILLELHGLNKRLDATADATREFFIGATRGLTSTGKPETEAERKARIEAEMQRLAKDFEYRLNAPLPPTSLTRPPRSAGQRSSQSPSRSTPQIPPAGR